MVESFVWSIGLTFEPKNGNFRRVMTKVGTIITLIDDIYDIYGTSEELKFFTEVIGRLVIKFRFFPTKIIKLLLIYIQVTNTRLYICVYTKYLFSYN